MTPNFSEMGVIGVKSGSGVPETCNVKVNNPLPCVVILIHGVNDIGEAFPNLDEGICAGLNQRLGRCDLVKNDWQTTCDDPDNFSPRQSIIKEGYSPIIPFYWGYRPVDKEEYKKDQRAYKARLEDDSIKDPELAYDSYWIEREVEFFTHEITVKKLNCDKFGNWIDCHFQRNGGPFSDATSCIPDMYGPGMVGATAEIGKFGSSAGAKVYDNPHRIYLAYAAHRLAKLIGQIRKDTKGQDIPINIVAHSQGTIITMLANLILAQQETLPADCVILAHSPYAFEPTLMENTSKSYGMGEQSKKGREQTFINFVDIMHRSQGGFRKIKFGTNDMITQGVISHKVADNEVFKQLDGSSKKYHRLAEDSELFYRNNFGKVYCYSSPNDHVVSLRSVQGMGWQGIPDEIIKRCQFENIKQRIFSHGHIAGADPEKNISEYRIPLILVQVSEQDYPQGISRYDYKQKETSEIVDNIKLTHIVNLTSQQLQSVRQSDFFKNRQGELISGFYQHQSGENIYVWYKPSPAEFRKDSPQAFYQNINSGTLKDICENKEQQMILDEIILKSISVKDSFDAQQQARKNCSKLFPGDISTANYLFTTRLINGEAVPEPIVYEVDKPTGKTKLSRAVHYNDLYNENQILERLLKMTNEHTIIRPSYIPRYSGRSLIPHQRASITDQSQLQKLLTDHPQWDRGIQAVYYVNDLNSLIISAYLSQAEFDKALAEIKRTVEDASDESSHHSGITMNTLAPKHIMAYDLAIGIVKGIKPNQQALLHSWRNYADWRSPDNADDEAVKYMTTGILPNELKESMNYPYKGHMPNSVVNQFYHHNYTTAGKISFFIEISKDKYSKLTKPAQWELPNPDLKEH
ncbi:DUF3274 domain-containing protein [Orbus wheelerorum]|uniref:T6SS effector phospholipase Tle3 domain-containing protein n=1 Tax=Orbus wheelerorum TaxID=3074111 RepID=UPI00370CFD38